MLHLRQQQGSVMPRVRGVPDVDNRSSRFVKDMSHPGRVAHKHRNLNVPQKDLITIFPYVGMLATEAVELQAHKWRSRV